MTSRQQAARLLMAVWNEEITPRTAINRWPDTRDFSDPSVDCAFQILWHFEADEVQQKTEVFYMDAQLELLHQVSVLLQEENDLPPTILHHYSPANHVRFYKNQPFVMALLESAQRFYSIAWRIAKQVLRR